MTTDPVEIKYETLKVRDVYAHASEDTGILVLETVQGRVALHMRRSVLVLLGNEIRHALERED